LAVVTLLQASAPAAAWLPLLLSLLLQRQRQQCGVQYDMGRR
jgi:hypothetical protein